MSKSKKKRVIKYLDTLSFRIPKDISQVSLATLRKAHERRMLSSFIRDAVEYYVYYGMRPYSPPPYPVHQRDDEMKPKIIKNQEDKIQSPREGAAIEKPLPEVDISQKLFKSFRSVSK